jgi:hypothetical protein
LILFLRELNYLCTALEEGIPITDPTFYSSESLCPDSVIAHVFRPAPQSAETIPLLKERITIMREVGFILCAVSEVIFLLKNLTDINLKKRNLPIGRASEVRSKAF